MACVIVMLKILFSSMLGANCFAGMRYWLADNFLQLYESKT